MGHLSIHLAGPRPIEHDSQNTVEMYRLLSSVMGGRDARFDGAGSGLRSVTGSSSLFLGLRAILQARWYDAKSFCQMQCRRVQGQVVVRRPQVQHVSLRCTTRVETTEYVALQIDRERSVSLAPRLVQGAGTA